MKLEAIEAARLILADAREQVEAMRASRTNGKGYDAFRKAWRYFLTSYYVTFQKLRAGADGNAASEAWCRALVNFCKGDELLNYLHQARNHSDHGLGMSAPLDPPRLEQVRDFNARVAPDRIGKELMINLVGTKGQKPLARLKVTMPKSARLVAVTDERSGKVYSSPTMHLGQRLKSMSIMDAADLALDFVESKVEEAAAMAKGARGAA